MSCNETLRTQAYLDGELEGVAAAEAEHHIEGCAECQALSSDIADLSDLLRREATKYSAPQSLKARIRSEQKPATFAAQRPPMRRSFWFGAAGGAGITAMAAAFAGLMILPPSAATLADSVVGAHTDALKSGKTIQVASSSHHTVKPWFAGRVPISPPVADFPQDGFTLIGGRVDEIAGQRAAVVVYRHGKHLIDLFVWADSGSPLPADVTRHGYHSAFWKKADLDFAAVSDTDSGELKIFSELVRAEPE